MTDAGIVAEQPVRERRPDIDGSAPPRSSRVLRGSMGAVAAMIAASWIFVAADGGGFGDIASPGGLTRLGEFISRLAGVGVASPPLLDAERWRLAFGLAGETLAMSVLATGMAAAGAIVLVLFGSTNLASRSGDLPRATSISRGIPTALVRVLFGFSRAVPELIWAMLVIFIFTPGILAGALALAIHNLGALGRLAIEVVEDVDQRPIEALRAGGAGRVQLFAYGVLPQVLPQLTTFLLYRWEVIIRTTAVIGFVAAAGLGYEFRLSLAFLRYSDVGLLLVAYVLLVWMVDVASAGLRRLAR